MNEAEERVDLREYLGDIIAIKCNRVKETEEGSKENQQATKEAFEGFKILQSMQKDENSSYIDERRLDAEVEWRNADREAEKERIAKEQELKAEEIENERIKQRVDEELQKQIRQDHLIGDYVDRAGKFGKFMVGTFIVISLHNINATTIITNKDVIKAGMDLLRH